MKRLTNKREADLQRRSYEKRLEQGYPRNIPEERFLRLAAYEDTGLEPEQVSELKGFIQGGIHKVDDGWAHVQELLDAEKAGRLVALPCKVGDTVWYIGGIHNTLVKPARVIDIIIADGGVIDLCVETDNSICYEDSINSFFLTREEAERALEGGSDHA